MMRYKQMNPNNPLDETLLDQTFPPPCRGRNKIAAIAIALSALLAVGQRVWAAGDMPPMPGMDHGNMQHEAAAPAATRDPHAYSGGYAFGAIAPHTMSDEAYMGGLMVHRLETVQSSHNTFQSVDLQGWLGKDYDQLVLKAEGEVDGGKLQEARTELLWSHAVATYWNGQLGVRHDSGLEPDQEWLALSVQGLAPYWFEVDAAFYMGEQGRAAARLQAEYELLITQQLILQPRIEANLNGKQDAARALGTGLTSLTTGLRLRYEIRRECAPYLGVEWSGKFGGTADYARAAGISASNTSVVAGIRFWF